VQINKNTGKIIYYPDYYTMGHISKFVDPGAYRIDSNTFNEKMEDVAFVNPDGSKVLIVCNRTEKAASIKVTWKGATFKCVIPAQAAATFKW
jgi:glucosylceramidase